MRQTDRNRFDVLCDCGNTTNVHWMNLVKGYTKSCGCLGRELAAARRVEKPAREPPDPRGPKTSHPLYGVWKGMLSRCQDPTDASWGNYGGRGIRVCDEWAADFWAFAGHMGERPEGTSINRINNDGHYEPGNVEWATPIEQAYNKRNNVYAGPHSKYEPLKFSPYPPSGVSRILLDKVPQRTTLTIMDHSHYQDIHELHQRLCPTKSLSNFWKSAGAVAAVKALEAAGLQDRLKETTPANGRKSVVKIHPLLYLEFIRWNDIDDAQRRLLKLLSL